jgi:2-dehydro-3-deoxyphosphooctonate aldolase (KDO 8-P synthase)
MVKIGRIEVGPGRPLGVIAGPCVLEEPDRVLRIAQSLAELTDRLGLPYVFKASFDKANRTSAASWRGPGLDDGLALLDRVRREVGVPVTTDVHLPDQAATIAQVADLLQIPAFLCRQTDLLLACAATGRPVNVKKGQFLAPWDMAHPVEKLRAGGAAGVIVTERGTTFGYNDLVVDFRGLGEMAKIGVPVCFDATHSVQLPGAGGATSGGRREHIPALSRAAIAYGVDVIFAEIHDDPPRARSDAATQLALADAPALMTSWVALRRVLDTAAQAT